MEHVYREFNADPDGLANEAIDRSRGIREVIVDVGWSMFDDALPARYTGNAMDID